MSDSDPPRPERHWYQFCLPLLLIALLVAELINLFFWLGGKQNAGRASIVGVVILVSWFCLGLLCAALPALARQRYLDSRLRPTRRLFQLGLVTLLLVMAPAWVVRGWLSRQVLLLVGVIERVEIPDPLFEKHVRKSLRGPEGPITDSDLAQLTRLHLVGVTDLTGIEHCTRLEDLSLRLARITDFSPLERLTSLRRLWLYSCKTVDLSAIHRCEGLEQLSISGARVTGMEGVAGLANLEVLELGGVHIMRPDLAPLESLSQLVELDLSRTTLGNIRHWGARIEDLSHLSGLTNLRRLNLFQLRVRDVGPLSGLTKLEFLDLRSNEVRDVGPLSGLTRLETLRLSSNEVSDISPLAGLVELRELWLLGKQIRDITSLTELVELRDLRLGLQVTDAGLEHLKGLTSLQSLSLQSLSLFNSRPVTSDGRKFSFPKVTDAGLEHLKGLSSLKELYLQGTQVTDEGVKKLQEALPNCKIRR